MACYSIFSIDVFFRENDQTTAPLPICKALFVKTTQFFTMKFLLTYPK